MRRIAPRIALPSQTFIDDRQETNDARSLCAEVVRWESCRQHMYVDASGHVATGMGHRLPNADTATTLPWCHRATGLTAAPAEIRAAFRRIAALGPRQSTLAYRLASDLILPAGVAGDLAIARIERDVLPGLRRLFAGFDRYPLPARRALVDMAYDVGLTELARFRNLIAACGARDFATAANHCHRQRSREPRNTATRLLLFAAANAAA
jgi:GH24 family phage-related lysozyme (muramidase)